MIETLDRIDYSLTIYQHELIESKKFGYPCTKGNEKLTSKLLPFVGPYTRELFRKKYGKECGSCETYEKPATLKRAITLTTINTDKEESWIINNPTCSCIRREKWELCSTNFCKKIGINFTAKKQVCELAFEISRDIIDPCVALGLAITTKAMGLGYLQNRKEEECKLDYKIILEQGCTIEYKVYKEAIQNGLSYDLIKLIYDNNLEIIYEGSCIYLKSKIGRYKLSNFHFDEALGDAAFKELVKTDPREFVRKYLSDYNLTETDIIKILT